MGQIAGRAGRHLADGTFGSTGRCPPFEPEMVERLENHDFDPLRILQWRNPDLSFGPWRRFRRASTSTRANPASPARRWGRTSRPSRS